MVLILISITNNSIKYRSFVYTLLNAQTVVFQTIPFSISFVCTPFYLTIDRTLAGATTPGLRGHGAMAMKGYPTFRNTPALLEFYRQIV